MVKRARVLLADDHPLILAGIRGLLVEHHDVVDQVGDGRSVVEAALRLRPDLIILDVSMPLLNGIEAARQIKNAWPEARFLFLSMHSNPAYLRDALDAGGLGYLLKTSAKEELREAVDHALNGKTYVSRSFDGGNGQSEDPNSRRQLSALTNRQIEVLQLVVEGLGNKEIASRLQISVKTVEFHRGRMMAKFGAHNVADLIRHAVQSGIVRV